MAALSVSPSVRPTRQLDVRTGPKYFLPLSVRYSVTADGRRSSLVHAVCSLVNRGTFVKVFRRIKAGLL